MSENARGRAASSTEPANKNLLHLPPEWVLDHPSTHDRFFHYVVDGCPRCDCHHWNSARNSAGRSQMRVQGTYYLASRLAWYYEYGEDPYPKLVLHTCDEPECVNPDHLYLGTQSDNVSDAAERGGRDYSDGLTEADVVRLRRLYAARDCTYGDLADRFNISVPHVCNIVRGNSWADAPGPTTVETYEHENGTVITIEQR